MWVLIFAELLVQGHGRAKTEFLAVQLLNAEYYKTVGDYKHSLVYA